MASSRTKAAGTMAFASHLLPLRDDRRSRPAPDGKLPDDPGMGSGEMNDSPLRRYSTCTTELQPPNGLSTESFAIGSSIHCPSTTNRYWYCAGDRDSSFIHLASPHGVIGVAVGFQSLKEPAKKTACAPAANNSNRTTWRRTDWSAGLAVVGLVDVAWESAGCGSWMLQCDVGNGPAVRSGGPLGPGAGWLPRAAGLAGALPLSFGLGAKLMLRFSLILAVFIFFVSRIASRAIQVGRVHRGCQQPWADPEESSSERLSSAGTWRVIFASRPYGHPLRKFCTYRAGNVPQPDEFDFTSLEDSFSNPYSLSLYCSARRLMPSTLAASSRLLVMWVSV